MLRSALSFVLGAAAGVVLWVHLTPSYHRLLAPPAEAVMTIDPRLRHAEMVVAGRRIQVRAAQAGADIPGIVLPADQLTYNVILLLGLLATNEQPWRDRGAARIAAALLVLFLTHVLAVIAATEATYATRTGAWGVTRYSPVEQDFWAALEYGYRLAGMFGIAFGCWWMTRSSPHPKRRLEG